MKSKQSQKNYLSLMLKLLPILLLIGAFFVPFASALKMIVHASSGDVITIYSPAFSFLFTGKIFVNKVAYSSNNICIPSFLSYVFTGVNLILLIAIIFLRKQNKILVDILAGLLVCFLLTAAILMFNCHKDAATVLAKAITGKDSEAVANTLRKNTTLEFGFLGVSLFNLLSLGSLLVSLFFDKTFLKQFSR